MTNQYIIIINTDDGVDWLLCGKHTEQRFVLL